jgi:hypothetical protein
VVELPTGSERVGLSGLTHAEDWHFTQPTNVGVGSNCGCAGGMEVSTKASYVDISESSACKKVLSGRGRVSTRLVPFRRWKGCTVTR